MNKIKPPRHLAAAGKRLWARVMEVADPEPGCELILRQLCEVEDRLEAVRAVLRKEGVTAGGGGKLTGRHPLLDVEAKLLASWANLWKVSGLATVGDEPRGKGRPIGS